MSKQLGKAGRGRVAPQKRWWHISQTSRVSGPHRHSYGVPLGGRCVFLVHDVASNGKINTLAPRGLVGVGCLWPPWSLTIENSGVSWRGPLHPSQLVQTTLRWGPALAHH